MWTTLGEILELVSGQDFPPEKYNANIAGIPYIIGASNIENEQLIINRWTESPSVYSYLNDLLVVCKGAGVGKMAINNIGVAHIARQIQAVRGYTNYTDIKYIKAVVKNNIENIISKANGLIPGLKREFLLSLQLPLPPISEQRRIVCEIERWFFLIDQIEQGKADLQTVIKQAKSKILDLAIHGKLVPQNPNDEPAIELLKRINPDFTPCDNRHSGKLPYEIPKTWVWCSHNSILDISGGSQPAKSYFETILKPNYIRLYQIRDYGESPVPVYIPINLASKQTKKGDILLARYGGSLGKVFYAEQGAYNVAMAKVIFKFENLIYKEFAYYYYLSDLYQGKLKEISRTAQTGFNITDFNDMYFPLPPINEQQRIVQKMEELFSSLDDIQKNLEV
ncbi:restriction endonuclease subunit S [Bacteroides ovatus]|uniref:restriction endonuclease subunit S n=1 Tax=Bacteroides ovatus TaxID=28116 RepID=UPI00321A79A7